MALREKLSSFAVGAASKANSLAVEAAAKANLAIENSCTGCTAALLEYKNQRFPDFDPMDAFTLE